MASLTLLYPGSPERRLAVIFVHGLGGHPINTWRHDSLTEKNFWPLWLGKETGCAVWTLGYNSEISSWQGDTMPLPNQGDQFLDRLDCETKLHDHGLVLIGHSMGGLVIKTALVHAQTKDVNRFQQLVRRVRAVSFIATPHNGAQLANLAKVVAWSLQINATVGDLSYHNSHLQTLHQQFLQVQRNLGFPVRSFAERHRIKIGGRILGFFPWSKRILVVDPDSAEPHVPREICVPLEEDHISICKPKSRVDQIHQSMVNFINGLKQGLNQRLPGDVLPVDSRTEVPKGTLRLMLAMGTPRSDTIMEECIQYITCLAALINNTDIRLIFSGTDGNNFATRLCKELIRLSPDNENRIFSFIAEEYENVAITQHLPEEIRLTWPCPLGKQIRYTGMTTEMRRTRMAVNCDFAIVMAGDRAVAHHVEMCRTLNKPFLPLFFSGGTTRRIFTNTDMMAVCRELAVAMCGDSAWELIEKINSTNITAEARAKLTIDLLLKVQESYE